MAASEPFSTILRTYQPFKNLSQRSLEASFPAGNLMFKVNNRKTRTRCELCSKLTIKTPKRRQCRRSGVFIVNFEHISHSALVFLSLTLIMYWPAGFTVENRLLI